MKRTYKPGERVPHSGTVRITPNGRERTVVTGEPFPPTPKPGQRFHYIRRTRH